MSKRREDRICKHCGIVFHPKAPDRLTYCGRPCAFADKAHKCKTCGKVFPSGTGNYCSDECKANRPKRTEARPCIICDQIFDAIGKAKCCLDCRKEYNRRLSLEYDKEKRSNRKHLTCKHCGNQFIPEYGDKRRLFCSPKCNKKYGKYMRRIKERDPEAEDISLAYIYRRDKGICQICKKKVPQDVIIPDPKAPTRDHIIALANGGKHIKRNVQLAHFKCNRDKGASDMSMMRLFD